LGEIESLTKKGIPVTGSQNLGGATVTAGGLVFVAGTEDEKIRAFDADTGKELWFAKLPFAGTAAPAVYEVAGRQYVVITATGGGRVGGKSGAGDAYVAFRLPESNP
jgi:quinoprotein glucose dehydrogenase